MRPNRHKRWLKFRKMFNFIQLNSIL